MIYIYITMSLQCGRYDRSCAIYDHHQEDFSDNCMHVVYNYISSKGMFIYTIGYKLVWFMSYAMLHYCCYVVYTIFILHYYIDILIYIYYNIL